MTFTRVPGLEFQAFPSFVSFGAATPARNEENFSSCSLPPDYWLSVAGVAAGISAMENGLLALVSVGCIRRYGESTSLFATT